MAEGVAKLYLEHVFKCVGLPKTFIHDRDTQFMSNFVVKMCQALGIKQNASTVFHPRTDGQSEKTNQKLEQFLRFYVNAKQNNWAQFLSLAKFAFNSWRNESTKKSPFELLIGYNPSVDYHFVTCTSGDSLIGTNSGSTRPGPLVNAQGTVRVDQRQYTETTCVSSGRPSMARWVQHQDVSTHCQTCCEASWTIPVMIWTHHFLSHSSFVIYLLPLHHSSFSFIISLVHYSLLGPVSQDDIVLFPFLNSLRSRPSHPLLITRTSILG